MASEPRRRPLLAPGNEEEWARINKGIQAGTFVSTQIMDLAKSRGTILMGFGVGYPNVTARHATDLYDINNLEQAHR